MNSELMQPEQISLSPGAPVAREMHAPHMDPIQPPTSPPRTFPRDSECGPTRAIQKMPGVRTALHHTPQKKNRLNPPNYSAHTKTREHIRINSPPPPTENHQFRKHTRFAPEMKPTQILCRLFNPCPVQELPQANRNKNQEETSSTTDSCFLTQHRGPGNWDTSISGR